MKVSREVTLSFRADENLSEAVDAACRVTGATRSELLFRCVQSSLVDVVEEIKSEREAAIKKDANRIAGLVDASRPSVDETARKLGTIAAEKSKKSTKKRA